MQLDMADVLAFQPDADAGQVAALVGEANAQASILAPCLESSQDLTALTVARGILRDVVLRRLDAGSGAAQTTAQTAGPFAVSQTVDTRQERRALMWPSEIAALQALCASSPRRSRMGWLA